MLGGTAEPACFAEPPCSCLTRCDCRKRRRFSGEPRSKRRAGVVIHRPFLPVISTKRTVEEAHDRPKPPTSGRTAQSQPEANPPGGNRLHADHAAMAHGRPSSMAGQDRPFSPRPRRRQRRGNDREPRLSRQDRGFQTWLIRGQTTWWEQHPIAIGQHAPCAFPNRQSEDQSLLIPPQGEWLFDRRFISSKADRIS